ncbi:MAG: TonB-dependent receptor [Bacteroidetes bacterium]|nr:TonB-dependent receptor [Bacteroidota bacterium]MBX7130642.1 TonB-dependent receptor [Flavobacteriales bacterium]HNM70589.1 TonB-dependent receptor [Flavobacteriales bacterium]
MRRSRAPFLALLTFLLLTLNASAQYELRGTVTDKATGETVIGAVVKVKGEAKGVSTDLDGKFTLKVTQLPPFVIVITSMGYAAQEIAVASLDEPVKARMGPDEVMLREAVIVKERISEKQKQAPLTVESMDVIAIKEAPSGDFYESLGTLKGVDMTAASMGFKVINTRGFNSTSPVRSLQLIDGVDNQSPGLNFSLGNFLGASDLDVMKVDIIAGASTAFYGPGAFNGVVSMSTKSPWTFPGLSVSVKGGERDLLEGAVRWAQVFKDKEGRDKFAYKLNLFALRATDWYAQNYGATGNSPTTVANAGGYDGVNIYGDENVTVNNDYTRSLFERRNSPGLGIFLRPGYKESDLVDYGTDNIKAGTSVHYKLTDDIEVIGAGSYSRGSTVYHGENRYRLKNIQFHQERLEIRQKDKWYVRGYHTGEDAGNTYDIFTTALRLQDASGATSRWNTAYYNLWQTWIKGPGTGGVPGLLQSQTGWYQPGQEATDSLGPGTTAETYDAYLTGFINSHPDLFQYYHQLVTDSVNNTNDTYLDPAYVPGTQRFDDAFNAITGKLFTEGGSRFYDRSRLVHAMGEYRFKPGFGEISVGGNFRQYMPDSRGTIFKDTAGVKIRNREYGLFVGLEKPFVDSTLKMTATLRMDHNQNFDPQFSPALSLVYSRTPAHVWRLSFSSAIRNPTLADQYFHYNVGRAILLGNVEGQFERGRDSLITVASFDRYRSTPGANLISGLAELDYFNIDRIRPEKARTIEVGYRGTHWESWYFDVSAYHSWYTDFIGYMIGIDAAFDPTTGFPLGGIQVYRLAANATSLVRTMGGNFGVTHYRKKAVYTFNYSYNQLISGADDPIIPAYNTPLNKFNLGVSGHEYRIPWTDKRDLGFGVNYKFIEGFTFTGSPQFSGPIRTYDMVDAQLSVGFPKAHLTVKLGASNLFGIAPLFDKDVPSSDRFERAVNNKVYMVYGGPQVGRLAYLQLSYELSTRN